MSVANRYKVLTISGSQCFTLLRSLATRETWLTAQIELATRNSEGTEHQNYLEQQLVDLLATRAAFNNTPFADGALS